MRWASFLAAGVFLVATRPLVFAVNPIPEAEQGPLARQILNNYRKASSPAAGPRKLHVVYFTPSDRDPEPRYRERLDAIMEDIRAFYREGMIRAGFGPETFDLDRDAGGKLIIHLVKGSKPESTFRRSGFQQDQENDALARATIIDASQPVLKAAGISLESETTLIFCNLAKWDEKTGFFSHHSPYAGQGMQAGGLCFAVDSVILNASDLTKQKPILNDAEWGRESLGKFNTVFIGGVAHELGHAFGLPHCGERWDEGSRGKSLMGVGNHTYRQELRDEGPGAFLTMASAMRLAGRPLFSKSDQEVTREPRLGKNEFQLSTNVTSAALAGRRAALRVEGVVKGTPPVYGVIAYFDSLQDGGYHAPTATSVPDADGHFAIEVSDLAPCSQGELRIEYCHVNGAVSADRAGFSVTPDGAVDLEQWEIWHGLEPLAKAVARDDKDAARAELQKIEAGQSTDLAKSIGQKLVATMDDSPKPVPANVSPAITELALGDARADKAEVGWLKPAANRIPPNSEIRSPLLDSGKIYATGLFAHAPSRYVFDLGGQWKSLHGEAGLHTLEQPYGSVVFVIKADGREVFRSKTIRKSDRAIYKIDVTAVKSLELIVEDAGDTNHNDWGLWLDPTLSR